MSKTSFAHVLVLFALFYSRSTTAILARFVVQCDDVGTYKVSSNSGDSWVTEETSSDWTKATVLVMTVTKATRVRFICKDKGTVGGFIGTARFTDGKGIKRIYDTIPYHFDNGYHWSVSTVASSDLVYTIQGEGQWGGRANVDSNIRSTAQWVWDGRTNNAIFFEFSFAGFDMGELTPVDGIDWDNNGLQFQELNDKIIENTNQIYYIGLLVVASFALIVICLSISNFKQCFCKKKASYNKLQQFDQSSVSDNV